MSGLNVSLAKSFPIYDFPIAQGLSDTQSVALWIGLWLSIARFADFLKEGATPEPIHERYHA